MSRELRGMTRVASHLGFSAIGIAAAFLLLPLTSSPAAAANCTCPATGQPSTGGMCPTTKNPPFKYVSCSTLFPSNNTQTNNTTKLRTQVPIALQKYVVSREHSIKDENGIPWYYNQPEYNVDQFIRDNPSLFPEAAGTSLAGPTNPAHLGLYVRPEYGGPIDSISLSGGGAAVQNDGYGVKDSAGLLAPGTQTPGFDGAIGGGGIEGFFDATRLFGLGGGQRLSLNGRFDYAHGSLDYNRTAQQVILGAFTGSLDQNDYTFSGGFNYYGSGNYLDGIGGGNFGNGSLTNDITGGKGDYNSSGYYLDAKLGHIFTLSAMRGRVWAVDVSGHGGYVDGRDNGFTDSSGFTYGTEESHFGDIGGRAKLFLLLQDDNKIWEPFVAGTVDGQLDFSHTLFIPNQAATVADNLDLSQGTTFGGVEGGLDVFCLGGMRAGISGFYEGSSDTNIEGGRANLDVPF